MPPHYPSALRSDDKASAGYGKSKVSLGHLGGLRGRKRAPESPRGRRSSEDITTDRKPWGGA